MSMPASPSASQQLVPDFMHRGIVEQRKRKRNVSDAAMEQYPMLPPEELVRQMNIHIERRKHEQLAARERKLVENNAKIERYCNSAYDLEKPLSVADIPSSLEWYCSHGGKSREQIMVEIMGKYNNLDVTSLTLERDRLRVRVNALRVQLAAFVAHCANGRDLDDADKVNKSLALVRQHLTARRSGLFGMVLAPVVQPGAENLNYADNHIINLMSLSRLTADLVCINNMIPIEHGGSLALGSSTD